jgi:hypothetical protein
MPGLPFSRPLGTAAFFRFDRCIPSTAALGATANLVLGRTATARIIRKFCIAGSIVVSRKARGGAASRGLSFLQRRIRRDCLETATPHLGWYDHLRDGRTAAGRFDIRGGGNGTCLIGVWQRYL